MVESLFDSIDRLIFNRPHIRLNLIMKEQSYILEGEKKSLPDTTNNGFQFISFVLTHEKLILKKLNLAKLFGFVLIL